MTNALVDQQTIDTVIVASPKRLRFNKRTVVGLFVGAVAVTTAVIVYRNYLKAETVVVASEKITETS